jgi:glycosyltransferase involved in cell wall biosynthesis
MELMMAQIITALETNDSFLHSIACLEGEAEIKDRLPDKTKVYCLHAIPNEPLLPLRLAILIRKIKPDVIHARNWGAWPDIALGRFLRWPIVPMIFSFHGLGRAGYMPLRRRTASKLMVHATTCLFTVSGPSRDMLVKYWGWPLKRTLAIPNGVDTNRFSPKTTQRSNRIIIGSVGNLRKVKNHALIFKACAKLVECGIDFKIIIAGEGNQRKSLVRLAKSLDIAERVSLPGRIKDIPAFLNKLDIFVLSSDSEQHPNALNEAMACGIASVGTRVGCVEELLDHGRCGKIVNPGDGSGLLGSLRDLAGSEKLRQKFARNGLKHVRASYSLDVMLQRYKELYFRAGEKAKL